MINVGLLKKRYLILYCWMIFFWGCKPIHFIQNWQPNIKAPAVFQLECRTTKGNFTIEAHRDWAPYGVDRLYSLAKANYFSHIPLYRIIPKFVAQFGGIDSLQESIISKQILPDDTVTISNDSGFVAYARDGALSRSSQFYINLKNNKRLDTIQYKGLKGFAVIGKVVNGMDVVLQFYSYGNNPNHIIDSLKNPKQYFRENFSKMDYIIDSKIIKSN